MSPIRRIWNVLRRRQLDDELQQEVSTHLALIEEEGRANGLSQDGARRQARMRFGSLPGHRERALDGVIATSLECAWKEIVFALRRLLRSPAFTVAAVLTLALAIGANAAIFAVVARVLLIPLAYPESDRLIDLNHTATRLSLGPTLGITRGYYFLYRERAHTLEGIALYDTIGATLTGDGVVRQRDACMAGRGSLVYGRGGPARRAAARGPVVRVVDAPLRRRPRRHRKTDLAVGRVHGNRRRHAAVVRLSRRDRRRLDDGANHARDGLRHLALQRRCQAARRRRRRRCPPRVERACSGCGPRVSRRPVCRGQRFLPRRRVGATDDQGGDGRRRLAGSLDRARVGWPCAARRLRERGQSFSRAVRGAPARAGRSPRDWRRKSRHHPILPGRKPAAVDRRSHHRTRRRMERRATARRGR